MPGSTPSTLTGLASRWIAPPSAVIRSRTCRSFLIFVSCCGGDPFRRDDEQVGRDDAAKRCDLIAVTVSVPLVGCPAQLASGSCRALERRKRAGRPGAVAGDLHQDRAAGHSGPAERDHDSGDEEWRAAPGEMSHGRTHDKPSPPDAGVINSTPLAAPRTVRIWEVAVHREGKRARGGAGIRPRQPIPPAAADAGRTGLRRRGFRRPDADVHARPRHRAARLCDDGKVRHRWRRRGHRCDLLRRFSCRGLAA